MSVAKLERVAERVLAWPAGSEHGEGMGAEARIQEAPEERRATPRVRVAWKVRAIAASGATVTCTVQDVSEGGARLALPPDAELPEYFHLYYPLRDLSLYAEVRWRKGTEVGIAFVENLDAEMRELRATITHLTERLEMLERAAALREATDPAVP